MHDIYKEVGCFLLWIQLCIFFLCTYIPLHQACTHTPVVTHWVVVHSHNKHITETLLVILYANWNHCHYSGRILVVATTEEYNNSYICVCFSKALMVVGLSVEWGVMLPATHHMLHAIKTRTFNRWVTSKFPLSCLKPGFSAILHALVLCALSSKGSCTIHCTTCQNLEARIVFV